MKNCMNHQLVARQKLRDQEARFDVIKTPLSQRAGMSCHTTATHRNAA